MLKCAEKKWNCREFRSFFLLNGLLLLLQWYSVMISCLFLFRGSGDTQRFFYFFKGRTALKVAGLLIQINPYWSVLSSFFKDCLKTNYVVLLFVFYCSICLRKCIEKLIIYIEILFSYKQT